MMKPCTSKKTLLPALDVREGVSFWRKSRKNNFFIFSTAYFGAAMDDWASAFGLA
jgi:hypothetical protein